MLAGEDSLQHGSKLFGGDLSIELYGALDLDRFRQGSRFDITVAAFGNLKNLEERDVRAKNASCP